LAARYSSEEVVFTFVYIREAHANDEWPNPSSSNQPEGKVIDIPSHSSLEDRIEVARRMKEEMGIDSNVEVLVDGMDDAFKRSLRPGPSGTSSPRRGGCCTRARTASKTTILTKSTCRDYLVFGQFLISFGQCTNIQR
jgi:hypothetical protein